MGRSIVIASGKGGTGKTSVTAGLATCLAAMNHPVCCIDADVGLRNLDIVLGLSDRAVLDFADVVEGRCTLDEALVRHPEHLSLSLLTAPSSPPVSATPQRMRELVGQIKERFEFCLIDCPAGLGSGFQRMAAAADEGIIVATTDLVSIRDAARTARELERLGAAPVRLVLNRVRPGMIARKDAVDVDSAMDWTGLPLLGVVPEDEMVIAGGNHGMPPIWQADRGAPPALINIANRLLGKRVPLLRESRF